MVRFDPELPAQEPSPKQPRTEMYSPTFAGNLSSRPSSGSGNVRRIIEDIELCDEDEQGFDFGEETWEGECSYNNVEGVQQEGIAISVEEKCLRGFHDVSNGPPNVSSEELAYLDREAMLAELGRFRELEVIEDFYPGGEPEQETTYLDTRLVFDWRFRDEGWKRRARLVAREFRSGDASNVSTFSPTSPLSAIKMLIVLSLLHNLMVCVMDISDTFLQVCQREFVRIQVPEWVHEARKGQQDVIPEYWQLGRRLPGQRNAAQRWAEHFGAICAEHGFENFQGGTIYRHRSGETYLSIHVDDIILVASEEFCISFHRERSARR